MIRGKHLMSESLRVGLQQIQPLPYLSSYFAPFDQTAWERFCHHLLIARDARVFYLWNFYFVSGIFFDVKCFQVQSQEQVKRGWWWWPLEIVWSIGGEKRLQKRCSFFNGWPARWTHSSAPASASSSAWIRLSQCCWSTIFEWNVTLLLLCVKWRFV